MKDWRQIEYFVPIQEVLKGKDDFIIRGVAINETTTRNNVRYKAEELSISAPSLRNRPILKDHDNKVDSIVGRTTDNVNYSNVNKRIDFEGIIRDKKMQEMISDGLIGAVSVGAMVHDLVKEESADGDSYMVAKGIEFVELSLVAVPADPNAGFERAIAESYSIKEAETFKCEECGKECNSQEQLDKHMESHKEKVKKENGGNKMTEEITENLQVKNLEETNALLNQKIQEFVEKEMNTLRTEYVELAKAKNVSVKEGYEKLSKDVIEVLVETLKSIKSPEVKEETLKGEIVKETKTEETKDFLVVEKSDLGHGYSLYNENLGELNPKFKWRD